MTQATSEKLDELRERAQSLNKSLQVTLTADEAKAKTGSEKATLAAQQIEGKLTEIAATHDADREKQLADAAAQFADTAALGRLTDAVAAQRAKVAAK